MEWKIALVVYIIFAVLLSEGYKYNRTSKNEEVNTGAYLVLLFLGPIQVVFYLFWEGYKKLIR